MDKNSQPAWRALAGMTRGLARVVRHAAAVAAALLAASAIVPGHAQAQAEAQAQDQAPAGAPALRLRGTLNLAWGDPHPSSHVSAVRATITLPDGQSLPLQLSPGQMSRAAYLAGGSVQVAGSEVLMPLAPGLAARPQMAVSSITALPGAAPRPTAVSGTRRVLYILLKFSDVSQTPHTASFFRFLTNPQVAPASANIPATLNAFFTRTSWGRLHWQADVAGVGGLAAKGWLKLPQPRSAYVNCNFSSACANLNAIQSDAMALVTAAGVDVSVYDNINFVLNDDLDCCAWGGGFSYNGKNYGATWEPPWGQETGTYAHEFGHSIGLPHSGWVYHDYDSPWDIMSDRTSSKTLTCGSYVSANSGGTRNLNCTEPGDGYIAPYKDHLGWIPAANKVVITSTGTTNVTLEADAAPLGSNPKMIKICLKGYPCTGSSAHYLTVEARIKGSGTATKYDNAIPDSGVIIHDFQANRAPIGVNNACFFNSQSGWAVPIDATPGDWVPAPSCNSGGRSWPKYALGNAQFLPGKTYTDATLGVSVAVGARSGSTYAVTVTRTK